jgi:hypothetical protein
MLNGLLLAHCEQTVHTYALLPSSAEVIRCYHFLFFFFKFKESDLHLL